PGWHEISRTDEWDNEFTDRYYVDESGSVVNGWLTLDGKTYYLDPWLRTWQFSVWDEETDTETWYVTDEDGALLDMSPGWHEISRTDEWDNEFTDRYYVDENGSAVNGWLTLDGKTYYCDPYSGSGFRPVYSDGQPEPAWYFFDEDGALVFAGVAKLTDVSMTLSEGFALNFYAAVLEAEGVYAEFTVGDGAPFAVREFTVGEDGVLRFTCPISAKELSQTVTAVLKAPDGTMLDSAAISGAAYLAELTEAAGYSAETAALAQALLAYGRAAEAYFLSGQPVTTGAVDVQSIPTWFRPEDSVLSDGGVAYYGRSLLTRDVTLLRLYFRAGQSFTVRAAGLELTARPNAAEGFYTVDIPVLPGALSQGYQITVDGTAIRFSVGVNDYITTVLQESGSKPALAELCKALYRCGAAAAALPQG
ncbi:MAG: hypothetical protein IJU18_03750, partial [Oscillospiraceae bacterium]|nr:hypothetical protein [Oscillospiraceae bacterium]